MTIDTRIIHQMCLFCNAGAKKPHSARDRELVRTETAFQYAHCGAPVPEDPAVRGVNGKLKYTDHRHKVRTT